MVVFQEGLQLQSQEELGVGWASGARGAIFALPKWPINQFKPVQQSRKQLLRAYCPNIYTVIFFFVLDYIAALISLVLLASLVWYVT